MLHCSAAHVWPATLVLLLDMLHCRETTHSRERAAGKRLLSEAFFCSLRWLHSEHDRV